MTDSNTDEKTKCKTFFFLSRGLLRSHRTEQQSTETQSVICKWSWVGDVHSSASLAPHVTLECKKASVLRTE